MTRALDVISEGRKVAGVPTAQDDGAHTLSYFATLLVSGSEQKIDSTVRTSENMSRAGDAKMGNTDQL